MAWAPNYATVQDLAQYVRIPDTVDNPELDMVIAASSRAVDRYCNRQFGATDSTEARTFETVWKPRLSRYEARIDDLMTQVGLVVTVSGAATTNYELRPYNAAEYGRPWTRLVSTGATPPTSGSGPYTVAVTATWGWTAVPETIKQATLLQATAFLKDRDAPYGVAGSPELGSEMRLLAAVHPSVQTQLRPYRRDFPRI